MSHVFRRGPGKVEVNLTPMVDVVFLLIVFFVLIAHISRSERFELPLPRVADAHAGETPTEQRVIINVVPPARVADAGGAYRVGVHAFENSPAGLEELSEMLRQAAARDPEVSVVVRAARGEAYERVHPALRACALAGVSRADLATEPEKQGAR